MCGIAGIWNHNSKQKATEALHKMNQAMVHRGPDDSGIFVDDNVALAHQRLAIIDLSPAGHQPMTGGNGSLELIFNGEIYNYLEIKNELSDVQFKTETDTEVILEAYAKWGEDCLQKFNGMFTIAIWDKRNSKLFIARDRLGIKPLYYYFQKNQLVFASELRTLLASGFVPRKIDQSSLSDYFMYQTVHAPETMVKDVKMLMPGHYINVDQKGFQIKEYWNLIKNTSTDSSGHSYDQVTATIRELFGNAIQRRLVSDVPFGAFLSGGIDSSAVVGYMSRYQSEPVKTFHISFDESEFSEAKYARLIADKFGADHHEFRLTPDDFLNKLPEAVSALDHPSGDGPNSWLVSKITRENGVTMALSGLGGDELFAGYPVFNRSLKLNSLSGFYRLPVSIRKAIGKILSYGNNTATRRKLISLISLPSNSIKETFPLSRQLGNISTVEDLLIGIRFNDRVKMILEEANQNEFDKLPTLSQVSYGEISSYMQNVLLRDTDQMSMASALEVRVPFLDYHLVEYVMGIKDEFKNPVTPKKLLTDSLKDLLPDEVVNRKKMGFTFPWDHWIKNQLNSFCESRIQSLAQRPFINEKTLLTKWNDFNRGSTQVRWPDMWIAVVLENWILQNEIEN